MESRRTRLIPLLIPFDVFSFLSEARLYLCYKGYRKENTSILFDTVVYLWVCVQGFLPSATLMIVSWAFLVLEALLLAEVNVELMKRRRLGETLHSEVLSLRTMADQTMGSNGGIFTAVTYLFLTYTLLVAYIAKSGEVLSLMLNIPMPVAAALFTFGFGGLLCIGGSKVADSVNQVLTVSLIGEHTHLEHVGCACQLFYT